MRKYLHAWMTLAMALLAGGALAACGGQAGGKTPARAEQAAGETPRQVGTEPEEVPFPFPRIPEVMTDPGERRSYLLLHYWDCYDFADTALLHRPAVTEQGLVNYLALVASHPDQAEADRAMDGFCRQMAASDEARGTFASLLEKYLYDPMSPLRDDALFVRFLDGLLAHAPADDARRDRWAFQRGLAGRNNPGQAAADFTYYRPDGTAQTLYGTQTDALLLLLFYDPECENCHAAMQDMRDSKTLARAVGDGRVTVLAVYTEGNPDAWRATLGELPSDWLVGTDREAVKQKDLYDLTAMPTLYLLDADKRVLLKDVMFGDERLEDYLRP